MRAALGSVRAAVSAQIGAQSLTGAALLLTALDLDLFESLFLIAALAASFRTSGTDRDRAVANFAACFVVIGSFFVSLQRGFLGDGGLLGTTSVLLLVAAVLFGFAGAFFWVRSGDAPTFRR